VLGNPPPIVGASTTICTRFNSRAALLCPDLDGNLCPTLTAHPEPLPFSELAETRSRQVIHISIRFLGWIQRHGSKRLTRNKFQRFLNGKSAFLNSKFRIREFRAHWMEWGKFLKGSVGCQVKLCFWNKRQITDLLLMQLASYEQVLTKKIKYQLYILIDLIFSQFFWYCLLILQHSFLHSILARQLGE